MARINTSHTDTPYAYVKSYKSQQSGRRAKKERLKSRPRTSGSLHQLTTHLIAEDVAVLFLLGRRFPAEANLRGGDGLCLDIAWLSSRESHADLHLQTDLVSITDNIQPGKSLGQ